MEWAERVRKTGIAGRLAIGGRVLCAALLKKPIPLVVGWNITYWCNLRCGYCGAPGRVSDELNTARARELVERLADAGTRFIHFSGGEPLLRDDLGDLVALCRNHAMHVSISSNGILVKSDFHKVRDVEEVQLSLDGPQEIHDSLRGRGAYYHVMEAIDACHRGGIHVSLTTVISRCNTTHIPRLLEIADARGVGVCFQPADRHLSSMSPEDIRLRFGPDKDDYRRAIAGLITEKKRGHRQIRNSLAGLRHLLHWPHPRKIPCMAGRVFGNIEPDGRMATCDMLDGYEKDLVPISGSVKDAFGRLGRQQSCDTCWSGSMVEFNLAGGGTPEVLLGVWRRFTDKNSVFSVTP